MGIVWFIILFSIVVIAHEFGHLLVAKKNGINVVEFSIGMGPKIVGFSKNGTRYVLRALPIGGICMFEGDDGVSAAATGKLPVQTEMEEDKDVKKDLKAETVEVEELKRFVKDTDLGKKSGSFKDATVWARMATVLAGPVFNFLLAFLFSIMLIGAIGVDLPVVEAVTQGSAAEEAGLKAGDTIKSLNGEKIHLFREISLISALNQGEEIKTVYERNGIEHTVVIQPKYAEAKNGEKGRYYIGLSSSSDIGHNTKLGVIGTIKYSAYEVKYWISTTVKSLGMIIGGKFSKDDVAGPIGVAQAVDTIYQESKPSGLFYIWINMTQFAILLSANLGVMNLLPIPALDGGRFMFLLIEAVRRKPIPPEKEGIVHMIGFLLLMLLMVVVLFNDIVRLFQ